MVEGAGYEYLHKVSGNAHPLPQLYQRSKHRTWGLQNTIRKLETRVHKAPRAKKVSEGVKRQIYLEYIETGETLIYFAEKYGLSKWFVGKVIDEMSNSAMRIGFNYKGDMIPAKRKNLRL